MIRKKNGKIEWLEFELLSEHKQIKHGVFLRHGGVSQDPFTSLNVGRKMGDPLQCTDENRSRITQILNIEHLISAYHIQGTHIEQVCEPKDEFTNCDGLMTSEQSCGLLTIHADCQAAMFFDPIHGAIANIHAGWRGQVNQIYEKTISKMRDLFQTKPEDLLVAISPSLGPESAEFTNFRKELPEEFWPFQVKPMFFDLWAISRFQLEKCGVLPHHIQIAEIDTYANPQDYFSYRREKASGKRTGNHGSVIALA